MPIIINEVEIQMEEPPAPQARGGGEAEETPAAQSPKLKPDALAAAMRVGRDRLERVRAD
jgi:hypothetical protein